MTADSTKLPQVTVNEDEPSIPERPQESPSRRRGGIGRGRMMVGLEQSLTFVVFIAIFTMYAVWLGESFVNGDQRLLDVHQNVPLLLVGLALALTLIAGQFDLSVGGTATLSCYLTVGLIIKQDLPMPVVLAAVLLVGAIAGLVNAFLVLGLQLNGFIATLGTGGVLAGISAVYSGGTQLAPVSGESALPQWFRDFGSFQTKVPEPITWVLLVVLLATVVVVVSERSSEETRRRTLVVCSAAAALVVLALAATGLNVFVTAMPWTILFLMIVATGLWTAMRYTPFGRHLYATGGNEPAARLAGVRTVRVTTSAFVLAGVLAAAAGAVLAAVQGSASPNIGQNFVLPGFAAAFLSTVILSMGRIHIWGTITGGVFLVWVGQGLVIGGINFTWLGVINGAVLVGAVSLSSLLRRTNRR